MSHLDPALRAGKPLRRQIVAALLARAPRSDGRIEVLTVHATYCSQHGHRTVDIFPDGHLDNVKVTIGFASPLEAK